MGNRIINPQPVIEKLAARCLESKGLECSVLGSVIDMLKSAPSVDAAEVVHGRWMKDKTVQVMAPGGQKYHNSCSVCGWLTRLHNLNYCPNCGAKMDGGAEQ